MIEERTGEAFEFDEQLTVVGGKLQPGDEAPEFELDYFDSENEEMVTVRLSDSAGSVRLLSVVNSLDTPVCVSRRNASIRGLSSRPSPRHPALYDQHGSTLRPGTLAPARGRFAPVAVVASERAVRTRLWGAAKGVASAAKGSVRGRQE